MSALRDVHQAASQALEVFKKCGSNRVQEYEEMLIDLSE
jgi:hypothetical protein